MKEISSFNLLQVGIDFAVLCMFLRALFHISAIMELRIASYLYICIASYLTSHDITMLKITSCFFGFRGN